MSTPTVNSAVKWAAELGQVREVSLLGVADLPFWTNRLSKMDLLHAVSDGQAQVLIVAADARYKGFRFQELSFSILISPQHAGSRRQAAYLLRAFNSRRLFAVVERIVFSTPYFHGDVRVSTSLPASIHLAKTGEVVFHAEMEARASAPEREPSRRGDDGWQGPVFLPKTGRDLGRDGRVFFARLRGYTQTFPFLPTKDSVTIRPSRSSDILQTLVDSHFVAKEWAIREDAIHAKSKTYKRAEGMARVIEA